MLQIELCSGEKAEEMKILIVDDSGTMRKLVRRIMEEFGECSDAVDGEDGARVFRQALEEGSPFQMVCLDITMPKMNGQESLREMRKAEKEHNTHYRDRAKIVMTTSETDAAHLRDALRGGADGYVVKPFTRDEMAEQLRSLELLSE